MFCAPGVAELQSLVTLEAIASGAPVIAADAVALPHLVRYGINGFLYPPDQTDQLTRHLGTLLGNPELRQQMGVASRHIAHGHDFDASLDTFVALYEQLARRRAAADVGSADGASAHSSADLAFAAS